jgi:Zn-dependent protease
MKWSLHLGRLAGIKIVVHWTFIFLIAWVVFIELQRGSDTFTILLMIAFVLSIFVCVVLHELGHSLMARKFGIDTKRITLLPIGGVASLERMPEEPKKELLIAVAGPAVNIVIALLLAPFINFERIFQTAQTGMQNMITPGNFTFALFSINLILVVFNAIPAFPMDGGRVLRALLAFKLNRVKATAIAAGLGQVLAVGFVFLGLMYNPFLILIGVFVFFGAYSENMTVQHLELLKGYRVRDAMMTSFARLSPDKTIKDAVEKLLEGPDNDIIVCEDDELKGVLSKKTLIESLKDKNMEKRVSEIMESDFVAFESTNKLTDVYSDFQRAKKSIYPVLERNKLVGAIDMASINHFVLIQSNLNY